MKWKKPIFDDFGYAYEHSAEYGELMYFRPYGWRCQNHGKLKLGINTDIGCYTYMNAKHGIEIGENTKIGSHCSIYSIDTQRNVKGKVIIGKNCKIGSHSLILPGVKIKNNGKIKAFSIIK